MAKKFQDLPAAVQSAILIVVAVGLAAGVFYFGIPGVVNSVWDLRGKIEKLDTDYKKLKAENDNNEVFKQQNVGYQNLIKQLETQLETLRTIVPDEQATDEFMRSVYDSGTGSAIGVRTFVAKDLVPRDFYYEMPFTVRIDGTYYNMVNFFDRLARLPRIVSVTGLSLGGPQGGGMGAYSVLTSETVGANCVITTYFNKPEAATPATKK